MNWSPLLIAAAFALISAVALILAAEHWKTAEPILRRWSWLFDGLLASAFGYNALDSLRSGQIAWGIFQAVIALLFLWSSASRLRRMRKGRSSSV